MVRQKTSQPRIFLGNFTCGALHLLRGGNAFALVLMYALLKLINQLFAAIARPALILPDAQGRCRIVALGAA